MRNTWDSWNTEPMAVLMALADSSEWPMGFSNTMRDSWSASPAICIWVAIDAKSSGAVAR
ncbi:hypothetical protein D3C73_1675460 [compost metagenome]